MSIHPQFCAAILDGTKRIEFRKRPLAVSVDTVVVYATQPVASLVGTFEVIGHDIAPPDELWCRHSGHAGIDAAGYRAYYAQATHAVGVLIGGVHQLPQQQPLTELPGISRPPQSFSYLSERQAAIVTGWLSAGVAESTQ